IGVVGTKEPFYKLFNQGMILGSNNEKMSKSKGNVINPDKIVTSHGADTLRLYEMLKGPLDADVAWSTTGLDGAKSFLDRVWRLFVDDEVKQSSIIVDDNNQSMENMYHETVQKVAQDFKNRHFNTGNSRLVVFVNERYKVDAI